MTRAPRYTGTVADLPAIVPFVGPETQERASGRRFAARLGANESGFGPSPAVIAALRDVAPEVWMYGDPEAFDLRAALAARHGVGLANIVVGEGIDGLLCTLARLLVAPDDPVVTSRGGYPTFAYHVRAQGGALTEMPYRGDHEDPQALADAARRTGAKLVYLANPDNPMGSWHDAGTVTGLIDALPEGCTLALDEAYADLAPAAALPAIDPDDPRVIRLRTFSKAHGLAGLRVGHAIAAPGLISAFDKVRNHFGVARPAQVAALAALRDSAWLAEVVARTASARDRIAAIAAANGLAALPSATNFVAVDTGRDGAFARLLVGGLAERGVFVRMPSVAPLDRCIRVSTGPDDALDIFATALADTLADLRAGHGTKSPCAGS